MTAAGLAPVVTGSGATTEGDGYVATLALLEALPDVTGIFAANDVMLLGALAALRERHLAVPEDVSVVGYDNSPLAASHYLQLTTVDDRSVDVGTYAAEAILARRDEPDRDSVPRPPVADPGPARRPRRHRPGRPTARASPSAGVLADGLSHEQAGLARPVLPREHARGHDVPVAVTEAEPLQGREEERPSRPLPARCRGAGAPGRWSPEGSRCSAGPRRPCGRRRRPGAAGSSAGRRTP